MRRILFLAPALMLLAGCVVHHVVPVETEYVAPPAYVPVVSAPAPTADVWYYDPHFMPEDYGGGWCYAEGAHRHDFYPDAVDQYVYSGGHYYYSGPLVFLYVSGHPVPGSGWCHHSGRHQHDYVPPRDRDFQWNRGSGWRYTGQYRATRPPPPSYWAKPVPLPRPQNRPDWRPTPAPAPRPVVNRPTPTRPPTFPAPAPAPAPWPRDDDDRDRPGHSGDAPGHGGTRPPGHDGTPPGQADRDRDWDRDRDRPGRSDDARGNGGTPPGQANRDWDRRDRDRPGRSDDARGNGGTPPGQADRANGSPQRPYVPGPFPNGRDDARDRNPNRAEPIPARHQQHGTPPGQEKKYDDRRPEAPVAAPEAPSRPSASNPFASPRRDDDRRQPTRAAPAAPAARDNGDDKGDRKDGKKNDQRGDKEDDGDAAKKVERRRSGSNRNE
jgi:hypothetical protein